MTIHPLVSVSNRRPIDPVPIAPPASSGHAFDEAAIYPNSLTGHPGGSVGNQIKQTINSGSTPSHNGRPRANAYRGLLTISN